MKRVELKVQTYLSHCCLATCTHCRSLLCCPGGENSDHLRSSEVCSGKRLAEAAVHRLCLGTGSATRPGPEHVPITPGWEHCPEQSMESRASAPPFHVLILSIFARFPCWLVFLSLLPCQLCFFKNLNYNFTPLPHFTDTCWCVQFFTRSAHFCVGFIGLAGFLV